MSHTIDGTGIPIRDIHEASDGRLIKYGIITRFSVYNKKKIIGCLIDVVKDIANEQIREYGITGLKLIQEGVETAANWQGADGMFADDLLCEICEILTEIKEEEILNTSINHIAEQMKDLITTQGGCPSGRLNRLHQIYMFLRDYKDGIHLPPIQRKQWVKDWTN